MGLACCGSKKSNAVRGHSADVNKSNVDSPTQDHPKDANEFGQSSSNDQDGKQRSSSKKKKDSKGGHSKGSHHSMESNSSASSLSSSGASSPISYSSVSSRRPTGRPTDLKVEAEIAEYDQKQLELAVDDRISILQHSHVDLSQPVFYPPPLPDRARTSLEMQLKEVSKMEPERETILKQTQLKKNEKMRKPYLAQERNRVDEVIRRQSITKAHIFETLNKDIR
ncbi:hypothetical protein Bpfe_005080 [Biomphalaria pfeifferi]|uniref:Uncharacterized protein n=1 Tax=Biomphalaria pfeifferi TaxID=112525 RepID=A0AAD8C4G5_BIOPF|nr:hypothetical protein Bpfe_005080 [Biomphalaria pfeifferi]